MADNEELKEKYEALKLEKTLISKDCQGQT